MHTAPAIAPVTLADLLPQVRFRTAALVVVFALFTAGMAQVSFSVPWTPVPFTGQTFAVLLTGTVLGTYAGAASMGLYLAMGLVGLPFYADGASGWDVLSGATGGYLVGFMLAAALVGQLAERRQDRNFVTSIPAMLFGTAVIYVCGVAWLAYELAIPVAGGVGDTDNAIALGLTPFLLGDAIKLLAAGLLAPLAWRAAERYTGKDL